MTPNEHAARFLERFDGIRHRMRKTGLAALLCWLLLGAVAAVALLAWIDFRFEDAWRARAVRLGALAAALILIALRSAIRMIRRWGRPETSAELERRFPELGQRVGSALAGVLPLLEPLPGVPHVVHEAAVELRHRGGHQRLRQGGVLERVLRQASGQVHFEQVVTSRHVERQEGPRGGHEPPRAAAPR